MLILGNFKGILLHKPAWKSFECWIYFQRSSSIYDTNKVFVPITVGSEEDKYHLKPVIRKLGLRDKYHLRYVISALFTNLLESQSITFAVCFLSLYQMTPLHVAAERGERIRIVNYLVDQGADINIKDNNGVSKIVIG